MTAAPTRDSTDDTLGATAPPRGMFASLVHRDYRLLWAANFAATFAMQMSQVARGWLVYAMTGSAVKLAWVTLSFLAPSIFFSLVGGVLADRVPKRRIMVLAQSVNCASTLVLALIVYGGAIQFWHFIAFGLLNGTVLSLSMPARQSIIPAIVGERFIFNAIALSSASMNLSRVLGPTVAGVTIAWVAGGDTSSTFGVSIVFFVIAVLYGAAAFGTSLLRTPGHADPRMRGPVLVDLFAGVRHIVDDRVLRGLFLIAFLATLFGMPVQFLMPAFSEDALGGGPDDLGLLMGAMGVGAITGSLVLARMGEARHKGWLMIGAAFAWALANGLLVLASNVASALPLAALGGFFSSAFMSLNNSLIQLSVVDAMRGRVMSVVMMMWGLMPIGVIPISFLAETTGIAVALLASSVVLVVVTLLAAACLPALHAIDRGGSDETAPL